MDTSYLDLKPRLLLTIVCAVLLHLFFGTRGTQGQTCDVTVQLTNTISLDTNATTCIQCFVLGQVQTDVQSWVAAGSVISGSENSVSLINGTLVVTNATVFINAYGGAPVELSCTAGVTVDGDVYLAGFFPPVMSVSNGGVVTEGGSIALICSNTNTPGTVLQQLLNPQGEVISIFSMYTLTNVRRDQAGVYQCRLTSINDGRTFFNNKTVVVHYLPDVSSNAPPLQLVSLNGNISLSCTYDSLPASVVTWSHNGNQLINESNDVTINVVSNRSSLSVTSLTRESGGNYTCTASNTVGTDSASVSIVIQIPPAAATNLTVSNEQETTFTISWKNNFDGFSPTSGVFVVVANTDTGVGLRSMMIHGNSSLTHVTLNDLLPLTNYTIELRVVNAVGRSDPVFTTGMTLSLPLMAPIMVMLTSPSFTSLVLDWEPPTPATSTAPPTMWILQLLNSDMSINQTVTILDPGTTEYVFPDLVMGTTYSARVAGVNVRGLGQYSVTVTNQTLIDFSSVLVFCEAESDPVWWLLYPLTIAGTIHTQPCPQNGTSPITGTSTRLCMANGTWDDVDTSQCSREIFTRISQMANDLFSQNITDINPVQVETLINEIITATNTNTTGSSTTFATDLNTINVIVNSTVNYLIQSLQTDNEITTLGFSEGVIDVFNNVLDESNMKGWQELQEDSVGSQQVLLNAESYGRYLAAALMSDVVDTGNSSEITLVRENIELNARQIEPRNLEDVVFPADTEVSDVVGSAQATIPSASLRERGAEDGNVSVVNILFSNLGLFLPRDNIMGNTTRPVTQVVSTQVLSNVSVTKFGTSAQFRFNTRKFSENETATNPRCAFWSFARDAFNSSWSTEGVNTTNSTEDIVRGLFEVHCESSHLTAFAVLMDVTAVTNDTMDGLGFSALTVVTLTGCSISILFLVISIIFFCSLRKELFSRVHYFVHLNLAIALLLSYVALFAGFNAPALVRGLCVFVAALSHYLFTAVFFWMLCEGIMLYLMLVVVFSELAKKWWVFFLLGWGVPVIPVVISVGINHDQYGNERFCWISTDDDSRGAIWALLTPILLVMVVNVFFLLAALRSLYFQRKSKMDGKGKQLPLFKQLFKASIILLPLLGITWIFGVLSASQDSEFLAWLSTIFNSLQGLFIFIFHVLRSEKVWGALTRRCGKKKEKKVSTASSILTSTSHLTSGTQLSNTLGKAYSLPTVSEEITSEGFPNSNFKSAIENDVNCSSWDDTQITT